MILTVRTDKPEAELSLRNSNGQTIRTLNWQAHRQLGQSLHAKIVELVEPDKLENLKGIVAYKGPGSFTGLRIGLSVVNALSYGLTIPAVATSGPDWQAKGLALLQAGQVDPVAIPEYGAAPHITQPKR